MKTIRKAILIIFLLPAVLPVQSMAEDDNIVIERKSREELETMAEQNQERKEKSRLCNDYVASETFTEDMQEKGLDVVKIGNVVTGITGVGYITLETSEGDLIKCQFHYKPKDPL